MTIIIDRIARVPNAPAIYALHGGSGRSLYVAYVGIADRVRARLEQHFVRRDSSVVTGTSAVALVPENVTEIRWWEHPSFGERVSLEAAEMVAFDVLQPALRSRGPVQAEARRIASDPEAMSVFRGLVEGPPTGRVVLPTLQSALDRIDELERRLSQFEHRA